MYERDFQFIMPVKDKEAVDFAIGQITKHFGGTTTFPLVNGTWMDKDQVIKDDNTLITTTAIYSDKATAPHPFTKHREDQRFMDELASEIAKRTGQQCIFEQEGLIGRCAFIAPKTEEKKLEKML